MHIIINGQEIEANLTHGIHRAVIISVCTWKRAEQNDPIDSDSPRMGWWADTYTTDPIGSRLWELLREKITEETIERAKEYVLESLQWLINENRVKKVEVEVQRNIDDVNRLDIIISIDGTVYQFREL